MFVFKNIRSLIWLWLGVTLNLTLDAVLTTASTITLSSSTTKPITSAKAVSATLKLGAVAAPPTAPTVVSDVCTKFGFPCTSAAPCCDGNTCDNSNTCKVPVGASCDVVGQGSTCVIAAEQCASGTTCYSITGLCQVGAGTTGACQSLTDCDQTTPQSCQNNQCQPCMASGKACLGNDDCCVNNYCSDLHTCTACVTSGTCDVKNSTSCCGKNNCVPGTSGGITGTCKACVELNCSCHGDLDCCQDQNQLTCINSTCTNCIPNGDSCSDTITCTSGTCAGTGSSTCCQGGGHTPQICLSGVGGAQCVACGEGCATCSANSPCCLGFACDTSSSSCCALAGSSCNPPGAPLIMGYECQNSFSTGCCSGLVCKCTDDNCDTGGVCQECSEVNGVCQFDSDCCQDTYHLECRNGTCYIGEFCADTITQYAKTNAAPGPDLNPTIGLDVIITSFDDFFGGTTAAPITPCQAAFYAYFYNLNLFELFNMAVSPTYADLQTSPCDSTVLSVNTELTTRIQNALTIMEAVCYNNNSSFHPQCGSTQGTPPSLTNQVVNISQKLTNYLGTQVCANPAACAANNNGSACATANDAATCLSNWSNSLGTGLTYTGSQPPVIFADTDVVNDLAVGLFSVKFTTIQAPRNTHLNGQTLAINDFINAIVDSDGFTIAGIMHQSNWTEPCACPDGSLPQYTPTILSPPKVPVPAPYLPWQFSDSCKCADNSACTCDLQQNIDGPPTTPDPTVKIYSDGTGCLGACPDKACSCTAADTTCEAVFTQIAVCSGQTCNCANPADSCECGGESSEATINFATGACKNQNLKCVCPDGTAPSHFNPNFGCSPFGQGCRCQHLSMEGKQVCPNGGIPGKQTQCFCPSLNATGKGLCTTTVCTTQPGGMCKIGACGAGNVCDTTAGKCYISGAGGIPGNNSGCQQASDCVSGVCNIVGTATVGSCVSTCVPYTPTATVTTGPSQGKACTPACPDSQFGCCFDGSSNLTTDNPDCVNNVCCLETINNMISNAAQTIADNLNLLPYLVFGAPDGSESGPQNANNQPCQMAAWTVAALDAFYCQNGGTNGITCSGLTWGS